MSDREALTPVDTFLCPECEGTKGKDEYIGRNERHVYNPCRECGGSGIVFRKRGILERKIPFDISPQKD